VVVMGQVLEGVEQFTYLGSQLASPEAPAQSSGAELD